MNRTPDTSWPSARLLDRDGRLRETVHRAGRTFDPISWSDIERLDLVSAELARDVFADTGWTLACDSVLFLCRYSDGATLRQPAWIFSTRVETPGHLPWYVGLENDHLPPPPWQILVIINATSGVRLTDLIWPADLRRSTETRW